MNKTIQLVTDRIIENSQQSRSAYLDKIRHAKSVGPARGHLSCGNLAHGFAASEQQDKDVLAVDRQPNIGIVTSYNDMLSAHQPYETYPQLIKAAARKHGAVAQVAGGVPAMCDGVTQGRAGMELSLFSRDLIAMTTGIALSHDMFDAVMCLGVCDKIVPGLMIGALAFGHMPTVFVPAGPMPTGLSNAEKVRVRQLYAEGKVGRDALLEAESASYHSAGTCTFYGTANSNQMLMEMLGVQLPGSSFVNPGLPLRDALTDYATEVAANSTALGNDYMPLGLVVDEKSIVNAIVGLMATGGSTNHAIHLIAIAKAAGIVIDWQDMADISSATPLLCRIYPNGQADVNHFQAAGGMGFLVRQLLNNGYIHNDVNTIVGFGMERYIDEPSLDEGVLKWQPGASQSLDTDVVREASEPFSAEGGLSLLQGNLGRSVIKVSAVKPEHQYVKAEAVVFDDPNQLKVLFEAGKLDKDLVAVVKGQGPKANGMPELHKLTPFLGVLQDKGYRVALVTDGRMSGASGKVPAAIHLLPEAVEAGPIAKIKTGDLIELDAVNGTLNVLAEDFEQRPSQAMTVSAVEGVGRELFEVFRNRVNDAEQGASVL